MTDTDRKRLASILGMLGSNSAGERDNAARQAEAFRHKHGLTWSELLTLTPVAPASEAPAPSAPPHRPKRDKTNLADIIFAVGMSALLPLTWFLTH